MVLGEFEWQTQDLAEHQVNVNLLGTMRITRELMPILRDNRSRIIVVSSHCADESLPGIGIYGATKAALHAWATSLRVEISKYGIEVVSFIPGQCKTSGIVSTFITINNKKNKLFEREICFVYFFSSFFSCYTVFAFAVIISRCLKINSSLSS